MRTYVTCIFLANSTNTGSLPRDLDSTDLCQGGVARSITSNTHVQEPMNRILAKYQSGLATGPRSTDSSRFSSRAARRHLYHLLESRRGDFAILTRPSPLNDQHRTWHNLVFSKIGLTGQ